MSVNQAIAARFEQIAQMLELLGEDRFRIAAHARAARTIADHPEDLAALATDRKKLLAIDGIGPKVADKIIEFVTTGKIAEHVELLARVPAGLLQVLQVPGLGPKTVKALWECKGVTDLACLKRIIDDGSILDIPRMGAKTVENLKAALAFMQTSGGRMRLGQALPLAEAIVARMSSVPGVRRVAYTGSLRRGKDTIGDIDIVVDTADPAAAAEAFCCMPGVAQVLARGEGKCSIRLDVGGPGSRWGEEEGDDSCRGMQIDMRLIDAASWGAALMYFTGSKEHNIRMRERALKRGLTLNEHGLYPDDKDPTPPHKRNIKPVAGATEEDVFAALGLPWIPPEIREDRGEMDLKATTRLVELADIKAELHAHTTASDGLLSIESLIAAAKARGFHTIAVTDHSKSSFQARGLTPERLREHIRAVRAAAAAHKDIQVLIGSEVDILADGSLDYDDDLLAELDIVVASPHAALSQDPKAATTRLVKAIEHPAVRILGHPTGRLINRRKGLEPAMADLYAAARANNVALEINAHWMRLDLRDTHVRGAIDAGCLIAIDCDVHAIEDFDNLRYGVMTARRGWVTPEQCVNTWEAGRLREWIVKGRGA